MKWDRIFDRVCVSFVMLFFFAVPGFAATTFTFKLDKPSTTSAGVFQPDGTLIRTLWSNVRYYSAGTNTATWDGKDDNSNTMPSGNYVVTVLAHNTEYIWDGAVGNTSAESSGPSVHSGFKFMEDMTFTGKNAFYVSGYNEGHNGFRRFNTDDPQHVAANWMWHYDQFGNIVSSPGLATRNWLWIATDGNWVYGACDSTYNPINGNEYGSPGCIVAVDVANNNVANFTTGVIVTNNNQDSFPNGILVGTQPGLSGLAVQQSGNLLAVSVAPDNQIYFRDKTSGAAVRSLSVNNPKRLSFAPNGVLWAISGTNLVCITNVSSSPSVTRTISKFVNPLALAVCPTNANLILVADGGSSQQIKAFDAAGNALWTYGLAGGYQANGPAVASNKFWFYRDADNLEGTFVSFAPDGSFWVGDGGNRRSLHFSGDRNYIEQIMYQPHSYTAAVDQNNPTRVFNQFLEFAIDYSKPLSNGWTLVNNWKAKVDANHLIWNEGVSEVTTFNNGRTYGFVHNNSANASELVEFVGTSGLRFTGIFPMVTNVNRWVSIGPDCSAQAVTIGRSMWYQATLKGYDANNNPLWNPETLIASASENGTDPVPRCCSGYNLRTAISSNNILISYDSTLSSGWHLGGIKLGGNSWLWKASPTGQLNGDGHFEIGGGLTYPGNSVQAVERQVIYGYHGEFFRSQGQASQVMHFYDNGLFVGEFGETSIGHNASEGAVPAFAGGNECPTLIKTAPGDYYLYNNDESGHGPQRWHFVNARNILELQGNVSLNGSVTLTNRTYNFPSVVTAAAGSQSATITWTAVPGASSYNVYYSSLNGGPYSSLAGSTAGTTFTINGLNNGVMYYAVVAAVIGGSQGTLSEQASVLPFDTNKNVAGAGMMTDGGQFPNLYVKSSQMSSNLPTLIGNDRVVAMRSPRELCNNGLGNFANKEIGSQGFVIYNFNGPSTSMVNMPSSFTATTGSGWQQMDNLGRQFSVDGVMQKANPAYGLNANPSGVLTIKSSDTNFHFVTVYSPAKFTDPRQYTITLTSTNGDAASYSVNDQPGYSHAFQFLFKGQANLTVSGPANGLGIVSALFFDNVAVRSSASKPPAPTGLRLAP